MGLLGDEGSGLGVEDMTTFKEEIVKLGVIFTSEGGQNFDITFLQ